MDVATRGIFVGLAWLTLAGAGCKLSDSGPEAAAVAYLRAAAERDAQGLYALLDPTTRERIDSLFQIMVQTRELITTRFPDGERSAALEAAGLGVIAEADTPAKLFSALVARSGERADLSGGQEAGLRPRSTEVQGDVTVVTTWGGDTVALREADGGWHATLSAEDQARLDALIASAERSLTQVRQAVAALEQRRFGSAPQ